MNSVPGIMKKMILVLLATGLQFHLPAQTNKADSLKALLTRKDDTAKVNILNQLTKALWYFQLDKATEYNSMSLKLADSLSYQNGLAEANRCRGVLLAFRYDSTSMGYLVKALNIFKQLNNKRGIAATLNNQNEYYFRRKQYARALEVLFQSLDLFEELHDKEATGAVTNQIGNVYNDQTNYSTALEYYLKALAIRRGINDKPGTAFSLNRVGDMYFKLNQLSEALGYYQQSLKMAQDVGRNPNIIDVAASIGYVYQKQGKYNDALAYFNISLKAQEEYFGKDAVAHSYANIGQVYFDQKNYSLSLLNFQKALSIAEKRSPLEIAYILHSIGRLYYDQGNFPKAIENCLRSLNLAKRENQNETIKNVSLTLSQVYASMREYEKAYQYHVQYTTASDSLQITDLNQKLAAVQQSFETKNRQSQIDLLNRDRELQQSELNRQKQQRNAFILGIIFVVIVAIVLARNNRQKQKANLLLEKTLSNLKSTQSQLIQSEKMASLGQLTAGIAHEIQNPLNFVNNFSDVNAELIEEACQEINKGNIDEVKLILNDIKENEQKINHHGKRADSIVKGMLQHSRSSSGVKELSDINTLADEYLRLSYQGLRAKDKSFNSAIKTDLDNSIGKINIVSQDIGRVLLNLYNNAFYAVNEKKKQSTTGYEPVVTIITKRNAGNIEIKVADNGNGIPQNIVDKIFQPFFTTKPTGQGTGLGLSLSYDIVKAHGGEINVNTKDGQGTEFIIQLPDMAAT